LKPFAACKVRLAVEKVTAADIDATQTTAGWCFATLGDALPELGSSIQCAYSFEGRVGDQRETLGDMPPTGLIIGLLPHVRRAVWVFCRLEARPVIVMAVDSAGIGGCAAGATGVMGLNLTILSLFGLLASRAIVVQQLDHSGSASISSTQGGLGITEAIETRP